MNVIKFHKTAAEMNEMFPQGMLVETINQNIKKEKKIQELEEEIARLKKENSLFEEEWAKPINKGLEEEIARLNLINEKLMNPHMKYMMENSVIKEFDKFHKEIDELKEENKKLKEEIYAWKYQFGRERLIENK